jgi:hypothetical protein
MSWKALHRRAATQHGVVSLACARDVDLAPTSLRSRAVRERWTTLGPGVWLLPGHPRDLRARASAALLSLPDAALTGWSAAALHGLRRNAPTRVELVRERGVADVTNRYYTARRSRTLTGADVTVVDGLRVVTLPRMARDLTGRVDAQTLRNLVIDARVRDRQMIAGCAALFRRDRRFAGRGDLRALVHELSDDGSDSGFEHRVVERLSALGLPPTDQQILVPTAAGDRHLDLGWAAPRVAIECLGFTYHATAAQLKRDVERQNAIAETAAWLVLQLTWEMFHRDWQAFEALLRRCLYRRTTLRAP